jgi:NTP pyrophosphatase (non-canonical NTP hydrolase)
VKLSDYQREVMRTAATSKSPELQLATMGLGIAGEAGEVADLLKKHIGHGHPLDVDKLKKELGDVLWYVVAVGLAVGLDLEDVAQGNVEKLRKRYPNGFSRERSMNRADAVVAALDAEAAEHTNGPTEGPEERR